MWPKYNNNDDNDNNNNMNIYEANKVGSISESVMPKTVSI